MHKIGSQEPLSVRLRAGVNVHSQGAQQLAFGRKGPQELWLRLRMFLRRIPIDRLDRVPALGVIDKAAIVEKALRWLDKPGKR